MKYSEKVMEHFAHPRNVGTIENADGVGEVGNPACGDIMTFYIKVNDGRLEDIKFQTFGCGAAIAVSSMVSEMAMDKTLDEAMEITNMNVANALDGLPKNKLHCSNLGADALHAAIKNYLERTRTMAPGSPSERYTKVSGCKCPYCDIENPSDAPLCGSCGAALKKETEER
jgi:nitrogen fixation NifU-like protein